MSNTVKLSEDKTFWDIKKILESHTPVFILRPEVKSRDVCILYLANALKVPIIKIALERVGPYNNNEDILNLVKRSLSIKGNKQALIWIKNINNARGYNFNILISDIVSLVNKNDYLIFSGICDKALKISEQYPMFIWDTVYEWENNTLCTSIFGEHKHRTRLIAPGPLHFRAYNKLFIAAKKFLGEDPNLVIENAYGQSANFCSIIQTVSLGIPYGDFAFITSEYPFDKHMKLMEVLRLAWEKKLPVIDVTQVKEEYYGKFNN